MRKLCFVVGNLNSSGGTERVASLIASELSKKGHEVSIVSLFEGDNPYFTLDESINCYTIHKKKLSFKTGYLKTLFKLKLFFRSHKFNSVIVVDSIACLFTIPVLISHKKVQHICWEHFNYKTNMGMKSRSIARNLAARYCDVVVTLTERDKEYWLNNTKKSVARIVSIPNPTPFPPQYNLNKTSTKNILAVGRLTYQKGFDLLLKSWTLINKNYPDWTLTIVGDGEDKKSLERLIDDNNLRKSVKLVGKTNNISEYYASAEFLCLSSRFEGFPMVLLEALSFGLPVVSFDCDTGPSELLNNTGSILVPPDNIDEFSKAMGNMIEDKNLRMSTSTNSIIKSQDYQPNAILRKWINLIEGWNEY